MTVPSTTRRAGPFTGNGATLSFPFAFKVFGASDIALTVADTAGVTLPSVLNQDYLVTLNPDQTVSPGGSVQYAVGGVATPLPTGYTLAITGSRALAQTVTLPTGGAYQAGVVEAALDSLEMQIQQIDEQNDRALSLSPLTPTSVDPLLPVPEASKLIAWNADADGLQNVDPAAIAGAVAYGTSGRDTFTGDGATTSFSLSASPAALNNLRVSVGGVVQTPITDYVWTGGTALTFTSAPPSGATVLVFYQQALTEAESAFAGTTSVDRLTATAGQTDFTLSNLPGTVNNLQVYLDGFRLSPTTDYTLPAPALLRLATPANVGQEVLAVYIQALPQGTVTDNDVTTGYSLGPAVSLRSWLRGGRVQAGAPGDTVFSSLQDAIDEGNARGKGVTFSGTWTVPAGLTLYSGTDIEGQRAVDSIIKLGNGLNTHLLSGTGLSFIRLANLTLDGNKANQTSGAIARCLYLLDTKKVWLDHILVKNAADHGVHVSTGATTDPLSDSSEIWVADSIFQDNGTDASTGNGGSGIAITAARAWVRDSWATGNLLAGFKFTGRELTAVGLHAESNLAGGFTTGFDSVTEEGSLHVMTACRALNNGNLVTPADGGDGFRHQGQVDRVIHRDCVSQGNTWAGLAVLANSAVKATNIDIYGGDYYNNGKAFTPSTTVSGAGIFISSTVGTPNVPSKIRLQGVRATDTQGTKTQTYGLEAKQGDEIWIGPGCDLTGNLTQSMFATTTAVTNVLVSPDGVKGDFIKSTVTPVSVTGTLTETDLQTLTIPASSLGIGQRLKIRARGTCSGTAGTKQIRLYFGNASSLMSSQLAADTQDWWIDAIAEVAAAGSVKVSATCVENGGQTTSVMLSNSTNINTAITVKVTGTLGNVADTATCSSFYVTPII